MSDTFSPEQVEALKAAGILTPDASGGAETAPAEPEASEVASAAEAPAEEPADEQGEPEAAAESERDEPLGEAGLKALRTEREARAKAEAEAKQLPGLRGQLTKATKALDEVSKERDELRSEVSRLRVAVTHGLSADDIELLPSGVSEEQLERLAVRLSKANSARRPAPDPSQGRVGDGPADPKAAFKALLDQLNG